MTSFSFEREEEIPQATPEVVTLQLKTTQRKSTTHTKEEVKASSMMVEHEDETLVFDAWLEKAGEAVEEAVEAAATEAVANVAEMERALLERQAAEINNGPVIMVDPIDYTEDDLILVARVIHGEAGSWWLSDHHQLMVANVLVNRAMGPEFRDTIREAAYQPGAYSTVWADGFEEIEPTERELRNAKMILDGVRVCPSSVVFQANFRQGTGDYEIIRDEHLGSSFFCYSENMWLYDDPQVFINELLEKAQ